MKAGHDKERELSIGCYNTRGLSTAIPFITKHLLQTDIIAISEHWLFPEALSTLDNILHSHRGFGRADERLERHTLGPWKRGQGGVALLWRKSLDYAVHKLEAGNDRVIGIRLRLVGGQKLFIFAVYLPHAGEKVDEYRQHVDMLRDLYRKYENEGTVIFMGDFNADVGEQGGPRGKGSPSRNGSELAEILSELEMTSLNLSHICTGPVETFETKNTKNKSTIDHIIVPGEIVAEVISCKVMEDDVLNMSDHKPVIAILKNKPKEWKESNPTEKLDWERAGDRLLVNTYKENVKRKLEGMETLTQRSTVAIEKELAALTRVLRSTAAEVIPAKKIRKHQRPYWSQTLADKHKEEIDLWLQWKEAGKPREKDNHLYKKYKESKARFRTELRRAKLLQEAQENEELAKLAETDDKTFWKKIRCRKGKIDRPQAVRLGDQFLTDPKEVREAWASHFETLGNEQEEESKWFDESHQKVITAEVTEMEKESHNNLEGILEEPFLLTEIMSVCRQLKNGKAGGNDGLTYEHIKYGGEALWARMTLLFNMMRELEYIPEEFKKGIKIPLLKQGKADKTDLDSHRGITLLNVMAKIWEKVLHNRWRPWLLARGIPHELQSGGQIGCCNITTAYTVQETLNHYKERNSAVYGCFLDTKKAYDTVWTQGMLYKVYREGVNGKLWRILKQMHTGNTYCVLLNGEMSREFRTSRGVNQGGVLSLTCYLLATNDIHAELQALGGGVCIGDIYCGSPALADDISLLASTRMGLEKLIGAMHDYGRKWRFQYAPEKSKCVVFGKRVKEHPTATVLTSDWKMGASTIPEVTVVTHVGVQHSTDLRSSEAIEKACKKGKSKISAILATGSEGHTPNPIITKRLYSTIVIPSMMHGCELWYPTNTDLLKLERVHRAGVKQMQGMHFQTETNASLGSLGMLTLKAMMDKRKLYFFGRLAQLPSTILAKKIFTYRLYSYILRRKCQTTTGFVRDCFAIAKEYGLQQYLENYWLTRDFPSVTEWKRVVTTAVNNKEEERWKARVAERQTCPRFYKIHHTTLQPNKLWTLARKKPEHRLS